MKEILVETFSTKKEPYELKALFLRKTFLFVFLLF
jgi:hypothetical protein